MSSCATCGGENTTSTWFCDSCQLRQEAAALASIHAARTGEVVIGNRRPDGTWSLATLGQAASACPDCVVEAPPRVSWLKRLWQRVLCQRVRT